MLLHFRHSGSSENALRFQDVVPCRHPPENAPAFPAYTPSMAAAEKCSCIFGIPAIHGGKKNGRKSGRGRDETIGV